MFIELRLFDIFFVLSKGGVCYGRMSTSNCGLEFHRWSNFFDHENQEYLDSVVGEEYVIYKAAAMSRIAQYQVVSNPDEARLYLDET